MTIEIRDFERTTDGNTVMFPVLGHRSVAEGLVEWSKKKTVGTEFTRETSWGLKLIAIAKEDHPTILIALNGKKLKEMMKGMGPISHGTLVSYGIGMVMPVPNNQEDGTPGEVAGILIYHPTVDGLVTLLHWTGDESDTIPVGRLEIKENGFFLSTAQELEDIYRANLEAALQEEAAPVQEENSDPMPEVGDLEFTDEEMELG
jgi:hypothetical protein